MQYWGMTLRCLKQCPACVFPEICFLFEILCMQKKQKQKQNFLMASYGDLVLNGKQKKPFVLLKGEVTLMH